MRPSATGTTGRARRATILVAFLLADVAVVALIVGAWPGRDAGSKLTPVTTAGPTSEEAAWQALDPAGRCISATELVTSPQEWPMVCRWRAQGEPAGGQAFPPPVAEPPWDNPRIEIYVDPAQSRPQVAHSIAHELGHMRLTREPTVGEAWLRARGLAPDTPWETWVEDYAEAFAAVFAPPLGQWYAPTAAPDAAALAALKAEFFTAGGAAGSG